MSQKILIFIKTMNILIHGSWIVINADQIMIPAGGVGWGGVGGVSGAVRVFVD
jgi:hypothetical protein